MGWRVDIRRQERGTKKEVTEYVEFATREAAVEAAKVFEADVSAGDADGIVSLESPTHRVSIVRKDFRGTRIWQASGPIAFTVAPPNPYGDW